MRCNYRVGAFFLCLLIHVEGAIRCYCNREECKVTHTCISHAEKCYSKLYTVYTHQNKTAQSSKDEHGCVGSVASESSTDSSLCDGRGDVVKQLKELEPLIMCCSDNMCNYRKSQDIHVDIIDPEVIPRDISQKEETILKEDNIAAQTNDEDVIFKAAVIAVPIAGGLILVILILMAVRMLREDYRRSGTQSGLLKAHSFIEQHFVRKDGEKCYKPKKSHSNSRKHGDDHLPVTVHQHSNVHDMHSRWTETNERLIKDECRTSSASDRKSHTCVSLLTADKQSNASLV